MIGFATQIYRATLARFSRPFRASLQSSTGRLLFVTQRATPRRSRLIEKLEARKREMAEKKKQIIKDDSKIHTAHMAAAEHAKSIKESSMLDSISGDKELTDRLVATASTAQFDARRLHSQMISGILA